MKKSKIFWGVGFIVLAILLILDAFHVLAPLTGVIGKISVWEILCGLLLLSFVIHRLYKGKIASIFIPLAFFFMLFEDNISIICGAVTPDIINNWIVLLVAILFTIGFHILFSSGKNPLVQTKVIDADQQSVKKNHAGGSLGHSTVYVNSESLTPNHVENNLGACSVYFENTEAYKGEGTLYVENNLGAMKIYVPGAWCAKMNVENNLGGLTIAENNEQDTMTLHICGENNLGSITVTYI